MSRSYALRLSATTLPWARRRPGHSNTLPGAQHQHTSVGRALCTHVGNQGGRLPLHCRWLGSACCGHSSGRQASLSPCYALPLQHLGLHHSLTTRRYLAKSVVESMQDEDQVTRMKSGDNQCVACVLVGSWVQTAEYDDEWRRHHHSHFCAGGPITGARSLTQGREYFLASSQNDGMCSASSQNDGMSSRNTSVPLRWHLCHRHAAGRIDTALLAGTRTAVFGWRLASSPQQ